MIGCASGFAASRKTGRLEKKAVAVESNLIVRKQDRVAHLHAIDEGAVRRSQIAQENAVAIVFDHGMFARHFLLVENQIAFGAATDDEPTANRHDLPEVGPRNTAKHGLGWRDASARCLLAGIWRCRQWRRALGNRSVNAVVAIGLQHELKRVEADHIAEPKNRFFAHGPRVDVRARLRIGDRQHNAAVAHGQARVMRGDAVAGEHDRVVVRAADTRIAVGDQNVGVFFVRKMQAHPVPCHSRSAQFSTPLRRAGNRGTVPNGTVTNVRRRRGRRCRCVPARRREARGIRPNERSSSN